MAHPVRAAALVMALLLAGYGYYGYLQRPKPHYATYSITAPRLTTYDEKGMAIINPLVLSFSESVAPLSQVRTTVTRGIGMSPSVPGTWFWVSDRELRFTPKDDWPVDGAFAVTMARDGLLARRGLLEDYRFNFRTQPFSARISESQFYQDPTDPRLKKLVATVSFSHPVDPAQFESRVSLVVTKEAEYLGLTPDSRHFTVSYDKLRMAAYVHSAALAMPRDDTPMTLRVEKGIRAARGGNNTNTRLEAIVTIPGRASLRFTDARMTVVDNARYEPEQILLIQSSSPVTERSFDGRIVVRLLPERSPRQPKEDRQPYDWSNTAEIGEDILARSQPVALTYVSSEEGGDRSHGFRFRAPVGRFLHVLVRDGVQGVGGYVSGKPYVASLRVDRYPQALTFLGQGALLSLSGDRKLGFLARDVEHVEVEIGRVLPNQLQHIAPLMEDFSRPSLYGKVEDKVVERFVTTRDYDTSRPGKPSYDSIDVGEYLKDRAEQHRGLFLLHIRAVEQPRDRSAPGVEETESEYDGEESDFGERQLEDTRLVLVTDLGFIVKRAKDGSRDVFVQSIRTGLPVSGARVDLEGRNGQPVLTATTDATGRAHLPKPEQARRERAPELMLVQKDGDLSFMPFHSNGRELNLSRFDTGGAESAESAQQLSSYLFSDRGIYRPGETVHLGMLTRTADWKAALAGLPLDVEVTDARGTVVARQRLSLSAASFDEITHVLPPEAPTGSYEAIAYLAKDDKRRETIGSTVFKVQEFEPDRLKVQLDLSAGAVVGWLKPDDVKARMTVAHLFGAAAAGRRVEGELSLTPVLPRFTKYPDYRFQLGEVLKEPYHEQLKSAVTDDKGVAELTLDLKRFVGRAYRLNVLGRAYEAAGGRNVAAQNGVIVSEAPYLVGVKSDGDLSFVRRGSMHSARWLAVNQQLDPVAAELSLDWVQRKYVSVLTQQGNGTLKYVSRLKEVVRSTRPVSIAQGGSAIPLPTDEPGDFVLVLRDMAGTKLNTLSYSVAGEANLSRSLERETELQVQLDKPAYAAGDTIEVSIRAPYVGAGLITIERDRVYQHLWFKTITTSSVQRIVVPPGFEGNGYVSVQFVRDLSSDELFVSPLSYGVASFSANLGARTESTTLRAPREVKPGSTLTIHVTPGEASKVAVFAVDEGILQVARYRTPDPLGFFFQKRMLEVQTSQILDLILPDFKRFLALAAPGGDADGGFARHLNPFNRKRKPPVAFWSGIIDVGPDGRDVRYVVPDYYNGRLRLVAVAASASRVGVAEASTEVKGDFILTPNVPAMAAAGDEFIVSVGVYNNTRGQTGPIHVGLQGSTGASVVGPATVDLTIADRSEGVATFRVKANPTLGSAALTFRAQRTAAASASIEESVSIRPAVASRAQLTLGRVDGATAEAPLTRDMYSERRKVEAAISNVPLAWSRGLSAYLDNYEYTCTEQLISKGMSALIVTARPEFGRIRNRTDRPLEPTFTTIRSRLNEQGGLGLWSSTPETAEFATIYAAHFLVDAREHGETIPQDVLTRLDDWLTRFAATPASTLEDARLRAYAVYLLTRQGFKPIGALANVEQELTRRYTQQWPTDLAAAYLASTYRLMQRNDDATRIMRAVPWSSQRRGGEETIYYDSIVHDAQLLYLLGRHFPNLAGGTPPGVLEALARDASGNRASSLSAAYTMLALDAFAKASAGSGTLAIAEIGKDGREKALPLPANAIPTVAISEGTARIRFSRQGNTPAYYVIAETGFDRKPPTDAISQGIEIIRDFIDASGNTLTSVKIGDEFFVRLRMRSTNRDRVPQVAIVDLLPGGVEPVLELQPAADSSTPDGDPSLQARPGASRALPVGVPEKSDWKPSHADVREDRFILYGDATKNIATFVYRVRANNAGTFQVPPAFAEGMYNRTISGVSRGGTLEVKEQ